MSLLHITKYVHLYRAVSSRFAIDYIKPWIVLREDSVLIVMYYRELCRVLDDERYPYRSPYHFRYRCSYPYITKTLPKTLWDHL